MSIIFILRTCFSKFRYEFLLTLATLISSIFYLNFDPSDIRAMEIFPWDSGEYRDIAEYFYKFEFSNFQGAYPFATRILFPAIYGTLARLADIKMIQSAYIINIFAAFFVVQFTFRFLRDNSISALLSFSTSVLYSVFWLGPIRYTGFYPGGSFAFESAIVCVLFYSLKNTPNTRLSTLWTLLIIFLLTIAREFVFYIILILCLINSLIVIPFKHYNDISSNKIGKRELFILCCLFVSSLAVALTRYIVANTNPDYSALKAIIAFGAFRLDFIEFFYTFFYAYGPFMLFFLIAISFNKIRSYLIKELFDTRDSLYYILVFISCGILFSITAGTDSDRFLLWFFPFFALIGTKSIIVIFRSIRKCKNVFFIIVLLTSAIWSRFYVPALPNIFFPGDLYNAYAGVRTNLDPDLFFGPRFLEQFRFSLKTVAIEDSLRGVQTDVSLPYHRKPPQISINIKKEKLHSRDELFSGSYKYDLNNIPFPLGFAHNQYELLVAHPYHGDFQVRRLLLFQWIALYIILILFISFILRKHN